MSHHIIPAGCKIINAYKVNKDSFKKIYLDILEIVHNIINKSKKFHNYKKKIIDINIKYTKSILHIKCTTRYTI